MDLDQFVRVIAEKERQRWFNNTYRRWAYYWRQNKWRFTVQGLKAKWAVIKFDWSKK